MRCYADGVSRRLLIALFLVAGVAVVAHGHGGLPVSKQIFFVGDHMVVPTQSWGAFVGPEAGPFRWICDEALAAATDLRRQWTRTGDGVFVVTDVEGVRRSPDDGCSWERPTNALSGLPTAMVTADPVLPSTVWALTYSATAPSNGLWRSDDDGKTFAVAFSADEYFDSMAISSDGKTLWLGATMRTGNAAVIHVSHDGGVSFSMVAVTYRLGGVNPRLFRPLALVGGDPTHAWLGVVGEDKYALLRARDDGADVVEQFTSITELLQVTETPDAVWAVTQSGLQRMLRSGGGFAAAGDLAQTQCLTAHNGALYACASDYAPDSRAVSRSDDNGIHFAKVLHFPESIGVAQCAAGTTVATICPPLWELYSERLGVSHGVDAGTTTPTAGGCDFLPR